MFGGALSSLQYSNTLQQQPAATASCCSSSLLKSQPIIMYACWDSSRRGSATCSYVLGLFSRWQPPPKNCQRRFFLYYSDLCPRFRDCPVQTHIDLSVSARHHTTRILVRSRRLLRVSAAAVWGVNSTLIIFVVIVIGLRHDFPLVFGDRGWSTS